MNILIVIGLLLVGVAALIGVFLIGFNDQRKETAQANILKQQSEIRASAPNTPAQPSLPTEPKEVALTRPLAEQTVTRPLVEPIVTSPNHASTDRTSLTSLESVQKLPALNGQFRELANEIRSLHQQASQFEQRLSVLTEMINHLESSQSDNFDIDEDEQTQVPSENTLA